MMQIGQYEKAVDCFLNGIKLAPDMSDLWNNMAFCYGNMGKFQDAYDSYKKAYELAGKKNALYGLALSARDCGMKEEAIAYCQEYREKYDDGLLDKVENELKTLNVGAESSGLYLEMPTNFLDYGSKNGYVEFTGTIPMIPELSGQANMVCKKLFTDLKEYMESEYGNYDAMRLHDLSASWSLFLGMGAVWHWNENWELLRKQGVVEVLSAPEGVDCIDDVVLDITGIGRGGEEGDELRIFAHAMCMVALTIPPKEKMNNPQYINNVLFERNKAMYMLGIAIEMHRLGMN